MIKDIVLKNCIPYKKGELTDCKKINFIFGSNGSGKTTISSFLDGDNSPRYSSSSIRWDYELHETIYVYNRNFRDRNIKQLIPGVFTLGSATIDDINEIERLKEELTQRREEIKKQEGTLSKLKDKWVSREEQFKDDAWRRILKKNEGNYQKAFSGFRNSKSVFCDEVKRRIDLGKGRVCDHYDLKQRADTLYTGRPYSCSQLRFDVADELKRISEIQSDPIWQTVIVGNKDVDIAALINELDCSSWVNQGRRLLKPNSTLCPFCQQQTITKDFRRKLEEFFDSEYEKRIRRMKSLLEDYQVQIDSIMSSIDLAIENDISVTTGELDKTLYLEKRQLLQNASDDNIRKIKAKIDEAGIKIELDNLLEQVEAITTIIYNSNQLIRKHNKLVEERDTAIETLTNDVWTTCIYEASSLVESYKSDIEDIKKGIDGITESLKLKRKNADSLEDKIIEKDKTVTSIQPTIDEINRSLKAYGFTNFTIQQSKDDKNKYCIIHDDGTPANDTLSEGEETFLTFLYFMQWTKGSIDPQHISDKKIIVLDDPVSSLDSNILYIVGAMIKELAKNIKHERGDVDQLFVLTHNVFFHKEASFDPRNVFGNDINFWVIQKDNGLSEIKNYGQKNPISTSYELLWSELRDNDKISRISIQNAMRRIIENYFRMVGQDINDSLVEKFHSVEEKRIARSLIYWINDGSHSIPDDLYMDSYTDAVPKYKEVFKMIFKESGQLPHYNMMMGIGKDENDIE